MSVKLFVGGLAWATNKESLEAEFSKYATVLDAVVLTDRETGRSRGFGFVTVGSQEEADAVIAKLDGQPLDGRNIRVQVAAERQGGASRGGFSRGGDSGYSRGGDFNRGGNEGGYY